MYLMNDLVIMQDNDQEFVETLTNEPVARAVPIALRAQLQRGLALYDPEANLEECVAHISIRQLLDELDSLSPP